MTGGSFKKVNRGEVLTASKYNTVNTFDKPESVKPADFKGYKVVNAGTMEVTLPALSVVTFELE
jgi:alpha-L-arabinofuranosidase